MAVVNSFDSWTLNPVCLTFKSSLDNCRSIKLKGFVHLSSRNTFYNHREVIFSQYTKSKETIAVLLKVLSKILIKETACVFILIFQRFILFYLPFLLLFFSNRRCTSLNYWYKFSNSVIGIWKTKRLNDKESGDKSIRHCATAITCVLAGIKCKFTFNASHTSTHPNSGLSFPIAVFLPWNSLLLHHNKGAQLYRNWNEHATNKYLP